MKFKDGDLIVVDFDGSPVAGRVIEYSHESRLYEVRLYNEYRTDPIMGTRLYYEDEIRSEW